MLKHKSSDFKPPALEYYLTEDVSQEQLCRIFECSPLSLMQWVENYDKEIQTSDIKPIFAYKIKQSEVKFVADEIVANKSIRMDELIIKIQQKYTSFDVSKRQITRDNFLTPNGNKSTFSNYRLTDVKNRFIHSLQVSDIDSSIYWTIELICSNNYQTLWDIIFYFYATYIHISNPKAVNYIYSRFKTFKQIYERVDNPNTLTDNTQIRHIFVEIITILCVSTKMYIVNYVGIPTEDFNMALIYIKYKAPNQDYVTPFYKENDPKHMKTFFNEFIYNIESRNCFRCYYWFEYILGYEKTLHKYKEKTLADKRDFVTVSSNYVYDVIWIFWEILLAYSQQRGDIYFKLTSSAFNLFSVRYSQSVKQTKKYFIYLVISFLSNNIDFNIPIIDPDFDMNIVQQSANDIYNELNKIHQNNLLL